MKALVVEDDEVEATLLCELLQRRGYQARTCSTAGDCLSALRSEPADVVITDVKMPGMSGIELCRELRANHPDVLVIVLTGAADVGHARAAVNAGAHQFLAKPIKLEHLELAIKQAAATVAQESAC
jgi:DNA-binding NtrC family response regulator